LPLADAAAGAVGVGTGAFDEQPEADTIRTTIPRTTAIKDAEVRRAFTLIELLVVVAIIGVLLAILLPAIQSAREAARATQCRSNLHQIGLGVLSYYDAHQGQFFLHHPFLADVASEFKNADSFAEIYWEDKIAPFVGSAKDGNEALAKQGIVGDLIYRCADDLSVVSPYILDGAVDGLANRTSYLMNSLLSHMTRRYGKWTFKRFQTIVGTSKWVSFSERNAAAFDPNIDSGNDPRQDDYDIWLGTKIIGPWIASERHGGVANYLYLDGHVVTRNWDAAVIDMYPDKQVLVDDGTYDQ
jgi:prepilin-type N-terminal cleavage/methylation domain-containing protein/prepilin-type processing-associated H-X9-DG protein